MKKNRSFIILLIAMFILLAASLVGCNKKEEPVPEGYSLVTFNYNGADGKTNESVLLQRNSVMVLPELTKEGYGFVGWQFGSVYLKDSVPIKGERVTLNAIFEKDYSIYTEPCTLFLKNGEKRSYRVGEYNNIGQKGGYKATVYKRKDFKGKAYTVAYKATYSGKVGSVKVERVDSGKYDYDGTDDSKAELLRTFAPRFYWAEEENFFPTTVEEAGDYFTRSDSEWGYFYEVKGLDDPDYTDKFLHGNLKTAVCYAFAVEKEYKYLDLSYFVYCPYNYGKRILGLTYGNHVGDWEHISVRLLVEEEEELCVKPVFIEYSAHSFRSYVPFDEAEKYGTHPVAYVAAQSHGMWSSEGTHVYVNAVVLKLSDECSKGTAWDVWEEGKMETYAYDALNFEGRGIGGSEWKSAFDKDYFSAENGAVTEWGNRALKNGIFYKRFDNGPSGPQDKPNLYDYYAMNSFEKIK